MRKIVPSLLLLLAACNERAPDGSAEGQGSAAAEPSDEELLRAASDPARVQALVDRAMAGLPDAATAQYRNVHAGTGGSACGEVSLKSAPFRPFVVTPDAVAVIAATPAIAFEDPSDLAADAWIRWCATPEELAKIGPGLKEAPPAEPAAGNNLIAPVELAPLPPTPPPPAEPAPSAGQQARTPAKEAPPPQIDSFFNSVQRGE